MSKIIDLVMRIFFGLSLVGLAYSFISIVLEIIDAILQKVSITISGLTQEYVILFLVCLFVAGMTKDRIPEPKVQIIKQEQQQQQQEFIEDIELKKSWEKIKGGNF